MKFLFKKQVYHHHRVHGETVRLGFTTTKPKCSTTFIVADPKGIAGGIQQQHDYNEPEQCKTEASKPHEQP